jgi:hypothetical protein
MGRKLLFFSGLFLILALPGLIFLSRAPVLIVGDAPFVSLYGASRLRQRQLEASAALFRRVKPVLVADNAGPDLVAFAVEEAASRPYGVIFPYRYAEGGRRYAGQFPGVRVIILDTRREENFPSPEPPVPPGETPDSGGPLTLKTRRQEDFFRAGLMAGRIFRAGGQDTGGGILVFLEKALSRADKDALLAGVQQSEAGRLPLFLNSPAEYGAVAEASCAILTGAAAEFLDRNLKIPHILFSWQDPDMASRETFIIFDDSPWALAPEAVRLAARRGGDGKKDISSDIIFPPGRIADKKLLRDLKRFARVPLPEG